MNGPAEIIPIDRALRLRRRSASRLRAHEPVITPQARRRRVLWLCGGLGAVVLALLMVDRAVIPHGAPPAPLTQEMRQGLYQRALDDVKAACTVPQARTGVLRQHCVEQARFLQQLPDCTGDCLAVARSVLNHR